MIIALHLHSFSIGDLLRDVVLSGSRRWWVHNPQQQLEAICSGGAPQALREHSGIDPKILKLADKYKMNTDVKRAVFCILHTSEDFMDAYEKMTKLALKGLFSRCCEHADACSPHWPLQGIRRVSHQRLLSCAV